MNNQPQALVSPPHQLISPTPNQIHLSATSSPSPSSTTAWGDHQNARGIYTYNNWSEWIHTCRYINTHNIGIFGTVETNLHWTTENKHQMHNLALRHLTTPRTVAASCSTQPTSSHFQPGGSLLLSSDRWTRRCHHASSDNTGMGRWTHLRMDGRNNIVINILCVYRVCSPSREETSTSNTAYLQQLRHLRTQNNHTCPRDQVLIDVGLLVQKWLHHD